MWTFTQDQILGMKWLNTIIGKLLLTAGLDTVAAKVVRHF